MIRTITIAILLPILFMGCSGNQGGGSSHDGYVINGTIKNAGQNQVKLQYVKLNNATTIDTATIKKDGSFQMKGYLDNQGIYMLRTGKRKRWLFYMNEKDKITLKANAQNPADYEVAGSKDAETFADFMQSMSQKQRAIQQKKRAFAKARKQKKSPRELKRMRQEYAKAVKGVQNHVKSFADSTSNPIMAAFTANMLNADQHFDFMSQIAEDLKEEMPNSPYTEQFASQVEKKEALTKGKKAPDIEMTNPQGNKMALSDLRGKVVLVDFWASWCKPCRVENPNVVKTYKKYKDEGFTIFSVSLDKNKKKWKQAIQQDNLSWDYHVSDLKGWNNRAAQKYQVNSIPATFLVDREGKIIAKDLRGDKLEKKLAEVMNGEDQPSS